MLGFEKFGKSKEESSEEEQGFEGGQELSSSEKEKKRKLENQIDELDDIITKALTGEDIDFPLIGERPKPKSDDFSNWEEVELRSEDVEEIVNQLQSLLSEKREKLREVKNGKHAPAEKVGEQEEVIPSLDLEISNIVKEVVNERQSLEQKPEKEKAASQEDQTSPKTRQRQGESNKENIENPEEEEEWIDAEE